MDRVTHLLGHVARNVLRGVVGDRVTSLATGERGSMIGAMEGQCMRVGVVAAITEFITEVAVQITSVKQIQQRHAQSCKINDHEW